MKKKTEKVEGKVTLPKVVKFHYHPKAVFATFVEMTKDMQKEEGVAKEQKELFEDACYMLGYAAERMKVKAPKKEEKKNE